jgi:hypothetical protein
MDPKSTDRARGSEARRAAGRRERHRARRLRREAWNLSFESFGTRIPTSVMVKSPTLLMAAVEEVCWRVSMDAWLAGRPSRWRRRAYTAWAAQLADLEEKRERLRSLVEAELLAC